MSRDPALISECAALAQALRGSPTLARLRRSPQWSDLAPRLAAVLATVRRHSPRLPAGDAPDPGRVMAVHWNIEHGNRYERIAAALLDHPQLQAADLVLLNEVDLGMARSGNRDVAGDLAQALGFHGAWAPLFLETTAGRDEDVAAAGTRGNQEGLFGVAILSRWPIGEVRVIELPSPERFQYEVEGMYGRHIALVAAIERPGEPLAAVTTHLEVHRTRAHRAAQMRTLTQALAREGRPVILAGDFNAHTFERGRWWDPWFGAMALVGWPEDVLRERLLNPDRGREREPSFDALRDARFEWHALNDRRPTLRLRLKRLHETRGPLGWLGGRVSGLMARAERRAQLRLDWFAGRGWRQGRGVTVSGLDGPDGASDHAPIVAEFR
jgi:endonuclease/exonuclease/phosphatase family metal-dependent hydrolase